MKKVMQRTLIFVLTIAMLIGLTPVKSQAAVTDKRSLISEYKLNGYPQFPKLVSKQQYYVIYEESYRDKRIEVCFFDIVNKADLLHIMWQGKGKAIDIKYGKIANDVKYYLDKENKRWVKFEEGWGQISTGANKVKSSNMDIYNASGNKILKKVNIKYIYFEESSIKMDKGDTFTNKVKTNLSGVKYKSSNSKIVSVTSSGKLKALKSGKVTITATASNGKTAKLKVTVR